MSFTPDNYKVDFPPLPPTQQMSYTEVTTTKKSKNNRNGKTSRRNINSEEVVSIPATSFERFKELPDEIRQLIWGFALADIKPEILRAPPISTHERHKLDPKRDLSLMWSQYGDIDIVPDITLNSLMATCFESREIALKQYIPIRTEMFPEQRITFLEYSANRPIDTAARQYFSPAKDTLAVCPFNSAWYECTPDLHSYVYSSTSDNNNIARCQMTYIGNTFVERIILSASLLGPVGDRSAMRFHIHKVQKLLFSEDNWDPDNHHDRPQRAGQDFSSWQCSTLWHPGWHTALYAAFPELRRVEIQGYRPGSEIKGALDRAGELMGWLLAWKRETEWFFVERARRRPGSRVPDLRILSDYPERFAEIKELYEAVYGGSN